MEVSPGFLLLAAFLNYLDGEGVFLWVLAGCLCHELGHLLVLRLLRIPVSRMRLTAVGAEICIAGELSYLKELLAALAGPGVNLLLAVCLSRIPGGVLPAGINLVLGMFNLVPVGRLDGGRVLGCLLSMAAGPETGEKVLWVISWMCAAGLCVAGCCLLRLGGNGTLFLVALWMSVSLAGIGGKRWN